jgi:hypothetical protein
VYLQQQYFWLNERAVADVPEPLKRDLETRAVERFFVNWILYPSNNGVSQGKPRRAPDNRTMTPSANMIDSGHMQDLRMLFARTESDSVLSLAVRAIAFADIRNQNFGTVPSYTKARQYYGAALNRMRTVINDQANLADDRVLSAMLLIDNFEVILPRHLIHIPD